VTIANTQAARDFAAGRDNYVFVGGTAGNATQDKIKAVLKDDFPQTEALTDQEFIDDQAGQINQVLGLIYALLALAIIVSLFGIVNTLVLSTFERTRELGMLRAVGMSRRQVRRMVRHESIITALIGAGLGIGAGLVLAYAVTSAFADEGLSFAVPAGSLIVLVVVATVAGVLAAILPARRASRLDPLAALAYE